eukprot:SAG11_NODE_23058_length_395_cov_57.087838_1_plen_26_part_10
MPGPSAFDAAAFLAILVLRLILECFL